MNTNQKIQESVPLSDSDRSIFLPVCLLALASSVLYVPSLGFDFLRDDNLRIVQNPFICGISNLPQGLLSATWPGNLYRPVPYFFNNLLCSTFGLVPWPMHLLNVLLHAGVGFLVFLLMSQFFSRQSSLWATLIFLIHPVHTETVANIDHGADLFAAFFGLLALIISLGRRRSLAVSLLCLFLASLSKESGLVFVLLLPLLSWWRGLSWKTNLFAAVPVGILSLGIRFFVLGPPGPVADSLYPTDNILATSGTLDRSITAILLLGRYLTLFVCPFPLSSDYSFAAIPLWSSWTALQIGLSLLALLSLLGFILISVVKQQAVALWGVWYFLAFVVTCNLFIPIGTIFAERLLYVPSVGLVAILVFFVERYRLGRLIPIICLPLVGLTFVGVMRWQSFEALAASDFAAAPDSMIVQHVYADSLFRKGDYRGAIEHELRARSIFPNYPPTLKLLQAAYYFTSDFPAAEQLSEELLQANVMDSKVLSTAAWVAFRLGKIQRAEEIFQNTLENYPGFVPAQIGLFAIAVSRGDKERARSLDAAIPDAAKSLSIYREFAGI